MKIEKYPCVVWTGAEGYRVVATMDGPKVEKLGPPDAEGAPAWLAADLGTDGMQLLGAYNDLLQECQGLYDCKPGIPVVESVSGEFPAASSSSVRTTKEGLEWAKKDAD